MNSDTSDFLESLLWALPEDHAARKNGWTVREFHPEFIAAVDSFLSGFREYLLLKADALAEGPEDQFSEDLWSLYDSPEDAGSRSFGGNVYFSLSGHGVGFWDEAETKPLQTALEAYAGSRHAFEHIDLCKFSGRIHLAYRTAAFRREELAGLFTPAAGLTATPAAP